MKTHTKKQRELRNTLIGWLLVMPSLIFMAAFLYGRSFGASGSALQNISSV